MTDEREILQRVASGDLSPEEAEELLQAATTTEPPAAPTGGEGPAGRVRFVGTFRTAKIIGDPDVREAVVDGPHVLRRDGEVLVIEDEDEPEPAFVGAIKDDHGTFRFRSKRKHVTIGMGSRPAPLEIRMNPSLPLEVELAAGTLQVRDIRAPITADVSAGSAHLDGIAAPINVSVAAGSLHARGVLDHGDSRIKCDAGSVVLALEAGSSVRISSQVGLGKVEVPGEAGDARSAFVIEGKRESVVGEGTGTLSIECSLGKVVVTAAR